VDGDLVALDIADGSEGWRTEFDAPAETTPTVDDGTVYVTDTAGTLHAHAVDDGAEQWTVQVEEPGRGTAAAVVADELYVGTDAALHALTTGGERRWQVSLAQATTPVVDTEAVYVGERGYESSNVFAFDREAGDERWRHYTNEKAISDYVQSGLRGPPTLVEGGLYAVAADGIHALGR
jgi:outer membrane protein assembly factor BamB